MKFNAEASMHLDQRTSNALIHVTDSASSGNIQPLQNSPLS